MFDLVTEADLDFPVNFGFEFLPYFDDFFFDVWLGVLIVVVKDFITDIFDFLSEIEV